MNRITKIINNNIYKSYMDNIKKAEVDRVFCLHGIEHCLDVARISYIIALEEKLDIKKDVIYATALLHDIGRCEEYKSNTSHHQIGAEMAADILVQADYGEEECKTICQAIACHKDGCDVSDENMLKSLLYRADKLSRNCFFCEAYRECYWQESKKNHTITY